MRYQDLLFLDIDGVLISRQSNKARYRRTGKGGVIREFCPIASSNLLDILERAPSLGIVVSSSWRIQSTLDDLKTFLLDADIPSERIVGKTPDFSRRGKERGWEIDDWLLANPGYRKFVILDDSDDMVHLMPHLVRTTWDLGLTILDADRVVERLGLVTSCPRCHAQLPGGIPWVCNPCVWEQIRKDRQAVQSGLSSNN